MEQDRSSGGGERWSDSGNILYKELTGFPDRLKMRGEQKSRVKDHSQADGTTTWKDRVAIILRWEILQVKKVYRRR